MKTKDRYKQKDNVLSSPKIHPIEKFVYNCIHWYDVG